MASKHSGKAATADHEIVITRVIGAPRDLVFAAFTDRKHISNWWGPHGFSTTTREMDVRPGGQWLFTMHGPDGKDYPNRIRYTSVEPPRRIVYDHDDGAGGHQFVGDITLEDHGKRTLVTLRLIADPDHIAWMVKFGAVEGGHETLTRLDDQMSEHAREAAGRKAFVVTRTFDAPRDLVWKVHSEAEHLAHWWGPKGCKLGIERLEFRPGGMFHYAMRYSSGAEMWGRFLYREITRPSRIVFLNSFSNSEGGITRAPFDMEWPLEMTNAITLIDRGGRTELSLCATPHGSSESERKVFDGFFASLNQGYGGTLDQLAQHLSHIQKGASSWPTSTAS